MKILEYNARLSVFNGLIHVLKLSTISYSDSGFSLESKDGYFRSQEKDLYFLDYNNPTIKSDIASTINSQTTAGIILQNDFYNNPNRSTAGKLLDSNLLISSSNCKSSECSLAQLFGSPHWVLLTS